VPAAHAALRASATAFQTLALKLRKEVRSFGSLSSSLPCLSLFSLHLLYYGAASFLP
jgi:hypothetical protein